MATHHPIRKAVPAAAPVIPDKLYFRIGDVARLLEVPAYVLRFWETEFPQLKPNKGGTGQRLYRRRDVEMALRIKSLLYDQGYTIPGARQALKNDALKAELARAPQADIAHTAEPAGSLTIPEHSLAGRELLAEAAAAHERIQPPTAGNAAVRAARIEALRHEIRELLTLLSNPVSGSHPPVERPEPRVAPLRPLLVVEPRAPRHESRPAPRLQLHQPGMFGIDDPGPAAS